MTDSALAEPPEEEPVPNSEPIVDEEQWKAFLASEDASQIAETAKEVETEFSRDQAIGGLQVFFSLNQCIKLNKAIDERDFDAFADPLMDQIRFMNATCRQKGFDPFTGDRYDR